MIEQSYKYFEIIGGQLKKHFPSSVRWLRVGNNLMMEDELGNTVYPLSSKESGCDGNPYTLFKNPDEAKPILNSEFYQSIWENDYLEVIKKSNKFIFVKPNGYRFKYKYFPPNYDVSISFCFHSTDKRVKVGCAAWHCRLTSFLPRLLEQSHYIKFNFDKDNKPNLHINSLTKWYDVPTQ